MTTRTFNLATGDWGPVYSCSPRDAVIAAHAQSLGDFNTWDYEARYDRLVSTGSETVWCGAFSARICSDCGVARNRIHPDSQDQLGEPICVDCAARGAFAP